MNSVPHTVPAIVPRPPASDVPPTTTAAITSSDGAFASTDTLADTKTLGVTDGCDDMTAEAIETFWKLGPERYDLTDTEDLRYVNRILMHRMSKVWGGSSQKKQEEAERVVRAMIGKEALSQDDQQQRQVESHDLLDDALLNAEEFDEIIARREDVDDLLPGDDEREAA